MLSRDAYIEKMKAHLDTLNENMNELEAKAKQAQAEAHEKYQAEVDKLQHQSKLAIAKLNEMKAAGQDTWEAMTTEMEKNPRRFCAFIQLFQVAD